MKRARVTPLLTLLLFFVAASCSSQQEQADRKPAVAGQFYPARKDELQHMLQELFSRAAAPKNSKHVVAIISPHAGYVYSGEVAASAYNQVAPAKEYENIFVLGPSHHVSFEGAAIYSSGDFLTPLGKVKVNRELAERLTSHSTVFSRRTDAHEAEHSVEVQLPFLQYVLKKEFKILPIVVGASSPETCAKIAEALRPYLTPKNLFIISTDFSHYPSYDDAVVVDKASAEAVLSNSAKILMHTIGKNEQRGIPNLATSMCGWPCVLTLLYMTQGNPLISLEAVQYRNSGDAAVGSRKQVVGYYAITVSMKDEGGKVGLELNGNDRHQLLVLARRTIEEYVGHRQVADIDPSTFSPSLKTNCGAFVTLKKNNELRGCIGLFESGEPLFKVVQQMSVAAATKDVRFSPVEPAEIDKLGIEISVLTPMRKIASIDEIEMGKHGIYIKKGLRAGTFLPQVATETGWSKEEFLGHCAQDKAGIGWDGWKDAEIFVYEAIVFDEQETTGL